MLNKIIKKLEEAKKYQIPHIEAGIDKAISIIKQSESEFDRHPLSDEDIERAAKEYAENENSAYTNDYYGFIAGANFAKQPIANEWVKVEDVRNRIKSNIQRYNVIPALEKTLDWLDSLLPHPPKK